MTNMQFCDLIKKYEKNLFRLAKSVLKNDADAEDAVGEAIVKSYAKLSSLKDDDKFRPWLFRILINEAYAAANRRKRVFYLTDLTPAGQDGPADDAYGAAGGSGSSAALSQQGSDCETALCNSELWEAVQQLEEEFRVVTVLFYYEDLTLKEIASALELREGTVKSRLSRARTKLRNIISDDNAI